MCTQIKNEHNDTAMMQLIEFTRTPKSNARIYDENEFKKKNQQ